MSDFRKAFQQLIRDEISDRNPTQANRLGLVTQVNNDGTITVLVDGMNIQAACPYTVVPNQQVVVMPKGGGAFNAVPTQPSVSHQFENPPYLTSGGARFATIHIPGDGSGVTSLTLDIQDQGSSKVFRLQFTDLDSTWQYPVNTIYTFGDAFASQFSLTAQFPIALSEDGAAVAVMFVQNIGIGPGDLTVAQYKVRLYSIGAVLQSITTLDSTNQIYQIKATLLNEFVGTGIRNAQIPPQNGYQGFIFRETTVPVSAFITSKKQGNGITTYSLYWLEWFFRQSPVSGTVAGLPSISVPCGIPIDPSHDVNDAVMYAKAFVNRLDAGGVKTPLETIMFGYIVAANSTAYHFVDSAPMSILDILEDPNNPLTITRLWVGGMIPTTQTQAVDGSGNSPGNLNNIVSSNYCVFDKQTDPVCTAYGPIFTRENQFPKVLVLSSSKALTSSGTVLGQVSYNKKFSGFFFAAGGGFYSFRSTRQVPTLPVEVVVPVLPAAPGGSIGIAISFTDVNTGLYMISTTLPNLPPGRLIVEIFPGTSKYDPTVNLFEFVMQSFTLPQSVTPGGIPNTNIPAAAVKSPALGAQKLNSLTSIWSFS